MSSDQARRTLNQLDNEIAVLEKKSADYGKKEATARINAARSLKNIPQNASASTIRSRQSQIDRYNDEAIKAVSNKADTDKKIADKRKKRADAAVKLQNEEMIEAKKAAKAQQNIQNVYEQRIKELTSQLLLSVSTPLNAAQQHIYSKQGNEEYDVFISHASEDKESIAEPICNAFKEKGITVWYDAMSISWGDSLRAKIDSGLRNSKFGIVIISNDYIKKGWTQYELDGLFQIEMTNGKTILPIWHNISKDEVQAFSPTLAGRKALTTALFSAEEIAEELIKLLSSTELIETINKMETPNE